MPKKTIRRFLPDHNTIKSNKHLQIFGELLHNANLWHLNRHSVAKAFAVGLFYAFVPVPFQMLLAAGTSIIVHANLPLAVALVWITNPFTMPAIFYFCWLVGSWIVGESEHQFYFEPSWQWVTDSLSTIGPAFFVGCATLAVLFSVLGYFGIQALWRYNVIKEWKNRKANR